MCTFAIYGTHVMTISQKRVFLSGLLIGAIAIGAFALRPGDEETTDDQTSLERNGVSVSGAVVNTPTKPLRSDPVTADGGSDDSVARVLQAVRDSLQRNDLVSAKVLLDTAALNQDDAQVLALQRELQAREENTNEALSVTQADAPAKAAQSAPPTLRPAAKADRVRGGSSAVLEHVAGKPRHELSWRAAEIRTAVGSRTNVGTEMPASENAGTGLAAQRVEPPVAGIPAGSQPAVDVTQPAVQTTQAAEPPPAPAPAESPPGPKTRAQVRAELDRARTDGRLPRFGNPDPYGPGGTPSFMTHPAPLAR
jgi:hypothetical protein